MLQGAKSAVAHAEEFKELYAYYTTRTENPLKKMQLLIVIACKPLRVIYTVLTKRKKYDSKKMLMDIRHPGKKKHYRYKLKRPIVSQLQTFAGFQRNPKSSRVLERSLIPMEYDKYCISIRTTDVNRGKRPLNISLLGNKEVSKIQTRVVAGSGSLRRV